MSKVTIIDHPLVQHKLSHIRDNKTQHFLFRELVNELTNLMLYEATRDAKTRAKSIETPLASGEFKVLDERIVIVPILRAGLGMLDGCQSLIPNATVGFIGVYRDEQTLKPVDYYFNIPPVEKSRVLVVDPMLATGGSVIRAIEHIKEKGPDKIQFMCILASPEGIERLKSAHPDVDIYCAGIDEKLDKRGYIIPGIGDCGDRLYGTI